MAETKRIISEGAEKHLYEQRLVLNHGHVTLVDYLGSDLSVVAAARISFAKDVNAMEADRNGKLINYLMKNLHTSPFEQAVMTFKVKMPIFVARQWIRHRTARPNEVSGRYSELPEEFYTPPFPQIKAQDKVNKQGSAGELPPHVREEFLSRHMVGAKNAFENYHKNLEAGIAKEMARIDLPLSTYTEMIWQMDLHNLLHFLRLRIDSHAQWEIRQYGRVMADIVKDSFPMCWAAFEEYILYAKTLSRTEWKRYQEMEESLQKWQKVGAYLQEHMDDFDLLPGTWHQDAAINLLDRLRGLLK